MILFQVVQFTLISVSVTYAAVGVADFQFKNETGAKIITARNYTYSVSYAVMSICSKGDALSDKYCNCSAEVASCDLSNFPGSLKEV